MGHWLLPPSPVLASGLCVEGTQADKKANKWGIVTPLPHWLSLVSRCLFSSLLSHQHPSSEVNLRWVERPNNLLQLSLFIQPSTHFTSVANQLTQTSSFLSYWAWLFLFPLNAHLQLLVLPLNASIPHHSILLSCSMWSKLLSLPLALFSWAAVLTIYWLFLPSSVSWPKQCLMTLCFLSFSLSWWKIC